MTEASSATASSSSAVLADLKPAGEAKSSTAKNTPTTLVHTNLELRPTGVGRGRLGLFARAPIKKNECFAFERSLLAYNFDAKETMRLDARPAAHVQCAIALDCLFGDDDVGAVMMALHPRPRKITMTTDDAVEEEFKFYCDLAYKRMPADTLALFQRFDSFYAMMRRMRLKWNFNRFTNMVEDRVIHALFPLGSFFNHCCDPNVFSVIQNPLQDAVEAKSSTEAKAGKEASKARDEEGSQASKARVEAQEKKKKKEKEKEKEIKKRDRGDRGLRACEPLFIHYIAARDIAAGEELCSSYIDPRALVDMDVNTKEYMLGFVCKCLSCAKLTELILAHENAGDGQAQKACGIAKDVFEKRWAKSLAVTGSNALQCSQSTAYLQGLETIRKANRLNFALDQSAVCKSPLLKQF